MVHFTELPDVILYQILSYVVRPLDLSPSVAPPLSYNARTDVVKILKSEKTSILKALLQVNRSVRSIVFDFLQLYISNGLQSSFMRNDYGEILAISEIANAKRRMRSLAGPGAVPLKMPDFRTIFGETRVLEVGLDLIQNPQSWQMVLDLFNTIYSLTILGTPSGYNELFQYQQYDGKFNCLKSLSFVLPSEPSAFRHFSKFINWSQLSEFSMFIDPYGGFTINLMERLLDILISNFKGNEILEEISFIAGNDLIFIDYFTLSKVTEIIGSLSTIKRVTFSHKQMKPASFSSYDTEFFANDRYEYRQMNMAFQKLFGTLARLPNLERMTLDSSALRKFHKEFDYVFKNAHDIRFANRVQVVLIEPTFIYPLPNEQLSAIVRLIVLLRSQSFSLKFGLQIEMSAKDSGMSLFSKMLTILDRELKYRDLKEADFELCWSIIEDSFIRQHNEMNSDDPILPWERPALSSSIYKKPDTYKVEPISEGNHMYFVLQTESDEAKRLQFWKNYLLLDSFAQASTMFRKTKYSSLW